MSRLWSGVWVAAVVLAGCNADRTLEGTAAVGAPIVGGTVTAVCKTGPVDGLGTTNDEGKWSGTIAPDASPCVLRVQGGTRGPGGPANTETYYSFAGGDSATLTVNLTPLSSLVVARAAGSTDLAALFADPGDLDALAGQIEASEDALADALTAAGFTVPTPFDPLTTAFDAVAANPYDQLLATIAITIAENPDLDDLGDLLERFVNEQPLPEAISLTEPATLNPALAGTYALEFHKDDAPGCNGDCEFTEGQDVEVVVNENGSLQFLGKTLTNPVHIKLFGEVVLTEIVWFDGEIGYALSNNQAGEFNEINVVKLAAGTTLPVQLGQLREAQALGPALLVPLAGAHSVAYQYRGSAVSWTSLTLGVDGSFTFTGGSGPNLTAVQVAAATITGFQGTISVRLDLNPSDDVTADDEIRLFLDDEGALHSIEYPISSGSSTRVGVRVGDAGSLPSYTGDPSLVTPTLTATLVRPNLEPADISVAISKDSTGVNAFNANGGPNGSNQEVIIQIPGGGSAIAMQSYSCSETGSRIILRTATGGTNLFSTENGGRCAITIDSIETSSGQIVSIRGHFTAELYRQDTRTVEGTVNNGAFYWVAALP